MTKMKDLRSQGVEELQARYTDLSKELFHMSNEVQRTRKVENPHHKKMTRKDRARVLTALREKMGEG